MLFRSDTDSFFKRNTALWFYKLMKLLGVDLVANHADFRLLSRRAVAAMAEFKEKNLLIKVKDEGNGIELHKIDMLFKRFETLGQTDANLSSGIGLSLVKEWVDMLHGTITVDSKLGYGSTFSISLPGGHEIFESDKNVEFILSDSESSMPMDSGITQNNEVIVRSFPPVIQLCIQISPLDAIFYVDKFIG